MTFVESGFGEDSTGEGVSRWSYYQHESVVDSILRIATLIHGQLNANQVVQCLASAKLLAHHKVGLLKSVLQGRALDY